MLAPIVLFVYNRPEHTKRTLNALKQNKLSQESDLFIFSDGAKNSKDAQKVKEVRTIVNDINGFKKIEIYESRTNKGLANSIIDGVTKIINDFGKVIVLEDDLITSKNFLSYMNKALDFYKEDKRIWSISGYNLPINIPDDYNHDVYLSYRASSWGWATWKDRWNGIDWDINDYSEFINNKSAKKVFNRGGNDMTNMLKAQMEGRIDSWAIRWCYNQFKDNSYTIYPVMSKVRNIGMDGSGVHCGVSDKHNVILDSGNEKVEFYHNLQLNSELLNNFKNHYSLNAVKGKISLVLKRFGLYKIAKNIYELVKF